MSQSVTDALRRAELRRFLKGDIESIMALAEKQERDRMCARAIHMRVLRQRATSGVVDIRGKN